MQVFINVDKDKRVCGWGSTRGNASDIEVVVTDDHELLRNPFIFTYSNGKLVKDAEYQKSLIAEKEAAKNAPTEMELLKEENLGLKLVIAEMAEEREADRNETQLAIAELAELISGGA
ncbi:MULTISPECIES: hypothetical protein [Peribacillus]|uniref:hypothetical protein n=1 Tax=Peribacillus TaxID=2675229 RepID=UPI001F4D71EC|nr:MULTISPECIES: hypothetical protein [unclassified Peribacillus]MCK1985157.1 hypothetical protein [Peribacillus sp. Aquil_B1]MCK2007193.1 hypothetical protein [Peribacillus sp. Aquil_B8]